MPQLICNPKYNVWMHMFAWQGSVLQLFQWINSWNPWRVDIIADTVRSLKHLVNPLTYSQEKLLFQSRWCRNLNGNSLSGRVPAALGGRLLHRASFKYVPTAFSLKLFGAFRKYLPWHVGTENFHIQDCENILSGTFWVVVLLQGPYYKYLL